MARYRNALPQLRGDWFLTDAGIETDLIFNHGIEIPEFAAHTLLADPRGRKAVSDYHRGFLDFARESDRGFLLDSQTWKAHRYWAEALGSTIEDLRAAVLDSVSLLEGLRDAHAGTLPVVLNGVIGPRGDAYAPDEALAVEEAEAYHAEQIGWMAETALDMVTAMTFTQSPEAAGVVRAARAAGLPAVVSFTVETDGRLPTGQPLAEAIATVDGLTDGGAAYFMVNCAHPDHFFHLFDGAPWTRRVRGVRCNASRKSHAELDQSTTLDYGDPEELGAQCAELMRRMPWMVVIGACCGADLRHVQALARAI